MSNFHLVDSQQAVFNDEGETLKIRPQSFQVFSILLELENEVVSKDHLLKQVWGNLSVTDDSVAQCIADIRRLLGPQHRELLLTIPKKGYRLSSGNSDSSTPVIVRATVPPTQAQNWTNTRPIATAIAGFVFLVLCIGYAYRPIGVQVEPSDERHSIAVLPFKNLSGIPSDDYLSDGTTEDLITDLSSLASLRVVSRNSSFAYQDLNEGNFSAFTEELDVHYILTGSVRRNGEKVRINVELTNYDNNTLLWTHRYDGDLSNLFNLQDRISESVVAALSIKLTLAEEERLATKVTDSLEAYSLYQRGRAYTFSNQRELGQEYLKKATRIDPAFANAYAALAVSHAISVSFGQSANKEDELDKAFRMATKAVSINKHSAEAYVALSQTFLLRGKHNEAIRSAKQAIDSNPSYAPALIIHGWAHALSGNYVKALDSLSKAVVLQPESNGMVLTVQGATYYFAGRFYEAAALLEESVALNPNVLTSRVFLTATYQQLDRIEDAEWEAQETLTLNPDFRIGIWQWAQVFKNKGRSEYRRLLRDLRKAGLKMN